MLLVISEVSMSSPNETNKYLCDDRLGYTLAVHSYAASFVCIKHPGASCYKVSVEKICFMLHFPPGIICTAPLGSHQDSVLGIPRTKSPCCAAFMWKALKDETAIFRKTVCRYGFVSTAEVSKRGAKDSDKSIEQRKLFAPSFFS